VLASGGRMPEHSHHQPDQTARTTITIIHRIAAHHQGAVIAGHWNCTDSTCLHALSSNASRVGDEPREEIVPIRSRRRTGNRISSAGMSPTARELTSSTPILNDSKRGQQVDPATAASGGAEREPNPVNETEPERDHPPALQLPPTMFSSAM